MEHSNQSQVPSADYALELLASKVHDSWWEEKAKQGFHAPADCESENHQSFINSGQHPKEQFEGHFDSLRYKWCDKCHPDMYPYEKLPDNIKEFDRATVRTVLKAQQSIQHG
jgi:hypothetical protein